MLPQVALVGAVYGLYSLGRFIAAQHTGTAFDHADEIWRLERWLHLPNEHRFQDWVFNWPWVIRAANTYYRDVHFNVTFGLLAWLCWRYDVTYRWIRNSLIASTVGAFALHLAYPLAPPRMLHGLGFVDTGAANSVSNHFAAMPSLHVGWAVLVVVGVVVAARSRWRWLWVLHPITTMFVVVVTANHYWLDGLVGIAIISLGLITYTRQPEETGHRPSV